MKLVEILARELKEWPDAKRGNAGITQDKSKALNTLDCGKYPFINEHGVWVADSHSYFNGCQLSVLASDYSNAIVTREMWQAEREKLKPKKASADGWIRNRGRKCPAQSGTLVDLKLRGGVIHIGKFCDNHPWIHTGQPFDIMYYRISKPADQQSKSADLDWQEVQPITAATKRENPVIVGPIQWRDRIREIDRTVEALEEERVSLIQRLEGEGFKLIDQVNAKIADAAQAHEGMSDWRNWKAGDILVCEICPGRHGNYYKTGRKYRLHGIDPVESQADVQVSVICESGFSLWCNPSCFKFHSRPSA